MLYGEDKCYIAWLKTLHPYWPLEGKVTLFLLES